MEIPYDGSYGTVPTSSQIPPDANLSNGLAEHTRHTLIKMASAFIKEKQVGREFWYFAVRRAAIILDQVPGCLGLKLTTPFELVHNNKPYSKIWFQLFYIVYLNHDTDNAESWSKLQAHNLDDTAVSRDDRSNSTIFYNPITSSYYSPPAFQLDGSRLPITNFPNFLSFDGGLTCGLLRNKTDPIYEPFPSGIRVPIQHENNLACGTIKNIPIPVSPILTCAESPPIEQPENGSISTEPQ